jgi:heme/copper-type cytochrome/quinol oxidase subunit 2
MKYLAWKKEPSDVGSTEDSEEFPISITILSICLGIFVILFIVTCICWKKSKKTEPDNKPESDLRINPYLNRS